MPKVIAFHGWLGSPRDWKGVLEPSLEVQTPSLHSLDFDQMTRALKAEPAWLVGYSMGGRLALHLWQRLQGQLPGLVLLSTRLFCEDLEKRNREEARWYRWLRDSPTSFFEFWDQLEIFKGSTPPNRKLVCKKGFRRRHLHLLKTWPLRRTHLGRPLFEADRVHLVAGALEPALAALYKEVKGAQTHLIEGASHRLLKDRPHACRDLLGSIVFR